jgi:murein DD-endopeptidase MepM/ murein hydrolase activator NlpD
MALKALFYFCKRAKAALSHVMPQGHFVAVAVLGLGATLLLSLESVQSSAIVSSRTVSIPGINSTQIDPSATSSSLVNSILENTTLTTTTPQTTAANKNSTSIRSDEPQWREFTVQNGDNLSLLFKRAGLNDRAIYELFDAAKNAKKLRDIRPGQTLAFSIQHEKLQGLNYIIDELNSIRFYRSNSNSTLLADFESEEVSLKPETKLAYRQASIDSSLFMAGKRAGMPNSLTMELANIFGWDIDFALDIQKGDTFKVMYEELFLEEKNIGHGKILAAEFTNGGKTFKAVRYTDAQGASRYYTPEGQGLQKAFLRMPIEFARISSHFSLSRKHPVLHVIRAHKGTDYAAATGTPIRATGDGKIIFAGKKGGYGNCIVIQHGQGIETLYGHMKNFARGMRVGVRVSQADVIGYVGSTGLASGPHLHYEFHMNGQVRNPMTVSLPKATGIDKNEIVRFESATRPVLAQLYQYASALQLAAADDNTTTSNQ